MSVDLQFPKVAVLGAGTMGAGIAQVCAMAGCHVFLRDVKDEFVDRGVLGIEAMLLKGVEKGKVTNEVMVNTLQSIVSTTSVEGAVRNANLVVEAAPESLELKQSLFKEVSALCPSSAVLASNTSSLSLAEVFKHTAHPERCVGMHFFNPVPIMALLEVVQPEATDQAVIDRVLAFAGTIGKEPIVVRDTPGFATSRLGVVLGLEAIRMVEANVASPGDIDKAMELGYRHPMGPLRLTDLVGLDVRMSIADYLRKELDNPAFEVPDLMRQMVKEGKLGKKSGQGFYDWS